MTPTTHRFLNILRWICLIKIGKNVVTLHTCEISEDRISSCKSFHRNSFEDKYETRRLLWSVIGVKSLVHCASNCLQDQSCMTYFYNKNGSQCSGHSITFGNDSLASTLPGNRYYLLEGDCNEIKKIDVKYMYQPLEIRSKRVKLRRWGSEGNKQKDLSYFLLESVGGLKNHRLYSNPINEASSGLPVKVGIANVIDSRLTNTCPRWGRSGDCSDENTFRSTAVGYIGDSCTDSSECMTENAECRANECLCVAGYSFSPREHTCKANCSAYGNDFTEVYGYFINGGNEESIMGTSYENCSSTCVAATSFVCRSFEYGWETRKCYLQAITKLTDPTQWYADIYGGYAYYQRDCR